MVVKQLKWLLAELAQKEDASNLSLTLSLQLVTGSDPALLAQFIQHMHTVFSMKELGTVSYFLGISVNALSQGYFLSQTKYATELLHKAGLTDCKPCSTPLAVKASYSPSSSSDELPFSNPSLYRSIVGGLQYLTITRPDLALAVNQACQHMHLPTNADFHAVKRLLRYVKGTLHHGLHFTAGPLSLHAFSDSNWAGDSVDRKSTSEYRALANATAELTWLQQLLKDMHIFPSSVPELWCDNISAMALTSNPVFHSRSKHIEIDFHFIRDKVVAKVIALKYVPTTDQVADIFTKPLSTSRFLYLKDKLLVQPCPISLQGSAKIHQTQVQQHSQQHSHTSVQSQVQLEAESKLQSQLNKKSAMITDSSQL
ncbi:uncharacterized protein LOC114303481 [Camellia sinensis]|uniref:uncharacterized protein LOC114303481 n=1 Tax=Camellia sinensis TaxID=4442 RepID=UPI0010358C26|nr:uncharacterized protein LOC114303481 [Camellia sinensis]